MNNTDTLYLFVFIFSMLIVLRTIFRFIVSLLQEVPQKLVLSNRELVYLAISISYCLTYIIKL